MDASTLFLLFLLLIAIITIAVLFHRYTLLKTQLPSLVQEQFEQWRKGADFEMNRKISERVREWRETEARAITADARREALTQAHHQFNEWCETELELQRREQRDVAMREAAAQLTEWKQQQERAIRQEAIQRSQAVTTGKITEQLVPFLPNFTYNPKDARFLGSPIDLIIFDGLSDEGETQLRNVVFLEIKTGQASLTRRERLVRDAIRAGRVKWVEWNVSREMSPGESRLFE